MLSIHSTSSDRELLFTENTGECFRVELKGFSLSAATEIWALDAIGLSQFFEELGKLERPWQGQRTWASVEGDFSLSATCSSLGAVTFRVELHQLPGAPEEWQFGAGIATEFGQLERLGKAAKEFFK